MTGFFDPDSRDDAEVRRYEADLAYKARRENPPETCRCSHPNHGLAPCPKPGCGCSYFRPRDSAERDDSSWVPPPGMEPA